ncbi:hypothetical protein [Halobacterium zhouii]|uniref:hypothetical protein n=1 Tax=Halobacterium zhouii TaxID=2902624 RepID=UPI001E2EC0F5|nr:hypothetical protein [Halobacterium zhouii]
MVALVSPLVLVPSFVLLAVFVAGWNYQFGDLPPARAVVVGLAALWTVYSVASLLVLPSEPVASLTVVVAFALLAVGQRVWRRVRA